jgi:hypothetical protein
VRIEEVVDRHVEFSLEAVQHAAPDRLRQRLCLVQLALRQYDDVGIKLGGIAFYAVSAKHRKDDIARNKRRSVGHALTPLRRDRVRIVRERLEEGVDGKLRMPLGNALWFSVHQFAPDLAGSRDEQPLDRPEYFEVLADSAF